MTDTMNTKRFPMLALAVAATLAQPAAITPARAQVESDPSLEGFSLPPSTRPQPEAQGPVTEGVSRPRTPRPTPAPAPATPPPAIAIPAPTEPAQAPTAEAPATERTAPRDTATSSQATTTTGGPAATAPAGQTPETTAQAEPTQAATPIPASPSPSLPGPSSETIAPIPADSTEARGLTETPLFRWGMLAALLAIFGISIAIAWQRFVRSESRVTVPVIEPPRPRQHVEPEPRPAPPPSPAEAARNLLQQMDEEENAEAALPLRCAFEVTRLSVTLMTATLSYRITLTNVSDRLFRDVSVGGDMVSAHSSLSMEQQMANAGEALEIRHQVPAMLPGQSIFLSGDLMLPIRSIRVVRKGEAALFVPLARLKIEAEGLEMALLRTSLVGQRPAGPGAGLRPFRLDLGPRIYSEIGQRTLAVPA